MYSYYDFYDKVNELLQLVMQVSVPEEDKFFGKIVLRYDLFLVLIN